jgi:protein-S-isoprenylcysteine O-methyltransferase Ste14
MLRKRGETNIKKVDFPSLLFVLSGLSVMATGFWTKSSLPVSRETGRLLGMFIFLLGMTLFTWAGLYLKSAFYGSVEPVNDQLVADGPYGLIRHPLYLSMIISLLGISIALRSFWGIVAVFLTFLPALLYRARLEERALEKKHGTTWHEFERRTFFLVPFLW